MRRCVGASPYKQEILQRLCLATCTLLLLAGKVILASCSWLTVPNAPCLTTQKLTWATWQILTCFFKAVGSIVFGLHMSGSVQKLTVNHI